MTLFHPIDEPIAKHVESFVPQPSRLTLLERVKLDEAERLAEGNRLLRKRNADLETEIAELRRRLACGL